VDQRLRDIQHINRSLHQVALLYNDMATMVIEQGTLLDNVEHNLSTANTIVKEGVKNIEQVSGA
jgi:syntaxin 16